jgi:hypothetical protein
MSTQTQELMPLIIAIAILLGVITTFVVLNTKRISKQDEEEFAEFYKKELRARDLQNKPMKQTTINLNNFFIHILCQNYKKVPNKYKVKLLSKTTS